MHTIISDASKTCLQITPNYALAGKKWRMSLNHIYEIGAI